MALIIEYMTDDPSPAKETTADLTFESTVTSAAESANLKPDASSETSIV